MALNNIAVLIDADNASAKTIGTVFQEIEKFGKIRCKKIYGDWGQTNLSSWQEAILRYAIDPMQQFSYVKGKNATDIALVIEAMDLLHSGEFDGFCLVSSDSDFASLAVRIRKNNIPVYGFGKSSAVSSFKQACDKFIEVDNLVANSIEVDKNPPQKWDGKKLKQDTKLMNALRDCVAKTLNPDTQWARYPNINTQFKKSYQHIQLAHYGYEKLIHIYKEIDVFEIKYEQEANSELHTPFIKLKKAVKTNTPNPQQYTTEQLKIEQNLINAIKELIKNNPKPEDGWTNISYIGSQLNQNPNIDIKKYGYAKFSDLIANIGLFDIKKQQNGVFAKLKEDNQQQKTKPISEQTKVQSTEQSIENQQTTTPINTTIPNLISPPQVKIRITTPIHLDVVMWRLTPNKMVRGDDDMIFYGQTQSADNTIQLTIQEGGIWGLGKNYAFACHLDKQPDEIRQIIFTVSSETDNLPIDKPFVICITQDTEILFTTKFILNKQTAQSMMMFYLTKTATGWQIVERQQLIPADLPTLCKKLGVEVSDD